MPTVFISRATRPPSLVDRDERCRFAPVRKRSGERCKLFAGGHVPPPRAAHRRRVGTQRSGEFVRHARDGAAAGERLRVYDQQLADLLVRGHAVEQRLRRILPDGGGRAGGVGSGCAASCPRRTHMTTSTTASTVSTSR